MASKRKNTRSTLGISHDKRTTLGIEEQLSFFERIHAEVNLSGVVAYASAGNLAVFATEEEELLGSPLLAEFFHGKQDAAVKLRGVQAYAKTGKVDVFAEVIVDASARLRGVQADAEAGRISVYAEQQISILVRGVITAVHAGVMACSSGSDVRFTGVQAIFDAGKPGVKTVRNPSDEELMAVLLAA